MSAFDFLEPIPKTTVSIMLPSRGVLYPEGHPAAKGKLTLSPMSMIDETVFLEEGVTLAQSIDKSLRRCLQDKLDINSLLVSDKFFLFMSLRAITYGAKYTFDWLCEFGDCNTTNTATVDIPGDFKMKFLSDEDREPFEVLLPDSGKRLSFRLLRGNDDEAVEAHRKDIEKKKKDVLSVQDTTNLFRTCRHIVAVDGHSVAEAPEQMVMTFFASLTARDRQTFQQKIAYYTPGIDTTLTVSCAKCGHVHEMDMPFTANFFRAISEIEGEPVEDEI